MAHHLSRTATLLALFVCAAMAPTTHAQIISDVTGEVELKLNAYYDENPDAIEVTPVGLDDLHLTQDRRNRYYAAGLNTIDYEYLTQGPAEAHFDIYTFADSEGRIEGNGGHTSINFDITIPAPFSYRFEAIADTSTTYYEVSFNDVSANAHSGDANFGGSFPLRHFYEDGVLVYTFGWHPYIDQGILPAGTYNVSALAIGATHGRYGVGLRSEGTASLHIQLLGDTDLDGTVDMHDLETVLNSWNQPDPNGLMSADLNGDGFVGIDDLNQVLTAWNADVRPPATAATVANVPEPATTGIFSACVLALTGFRMRKDNLTNRLI